MNKHFYTGFEKSSLNYDNTLQTIKGETLPNQHFWTFQFRPKNFANANFFATTLSLEIILECILTLY